MRGQVGCSHTKLLWKWSKPDESIALVDGISHTVIGEKQMLLYGKLLRLMTRLAGSY